MRTVCVVTSSRADYGIYLPLLRRFKDDPDLQLHLIATGMHLSPEFGNTVDAILADGFTVHERVESLLSSDSPEGIGKSMALGVAGFAQVFARFRPDILVVLGDRFEMFSAVLAALPYAIPVAHIHGGEITHGAIDDALRHAITKMSHIHFVSTEVYADRVKQLGEEPWRIITTGALSLDNLNDISFLSAEEIEKKFGLTLPESFLLVTLHPETLEFEQTAHHAEGMLAALEDAQLPVIFTLPNADTGGRVIISKVEQFVREYAGAQMVENLGTQGYFTMMRYASAMVGNSSSGILEAASFHLPVVNIGARQGGRVRAKNVIDVDHGRGSILAGIRQALSPVFRAQIEDLVNPYGTGDAADVIIKNIREIVLDKRLIKKEFFDQPGAVSPGADR